MVSVDLERAFDTVHIDELLELLEKKGVGKRVRGVIGGWYEGAKQRVLMGRGWSKYFGVGRGMRQGVRHRQFSLR